MPANHLVGHRKKTLVGTFGTLDSGLFADSPDPFITTHWRIAGLPCLAVFEAARVNIFAPTEQRAEERDFDLDGGPLVDATLDQTRQ